MTFNLPLLSMAAFGYMLLLFFIAYATDRGWLPKSIARHPLTYTLSIGVYATSWSYYGSVGFAETNGYNFLTVYLGVSFAFMLTPVLLMPILRMAREYQLTSLADLIAFRYRSRVAGVLVTLVMLAGILPYLALQIRAVTESMFIITQELPPETLALGFCVGLILFAILFGARHITLREKHEGLVVAIAFESLIKLIALLCVGLVALFGVWGGLGGLSDWLDQHPEVITALYSPANEGPWLTLIVLSFAAAFMLPRQFHMIFTENIEPRTMMTSAWLFPMFLLLINLPIPLILWAGQVLELSIPADYYLLGVALSQGADSVLPVMAFLGGVSAASAMLIVTSLALSSMCLNHLLLPLGFPYSGANLYRWLLWGRRILIAVILMAGYGFYRLLEHEQALVQLGLISFVAVAQFLPGIAGVLLWRDATRSGFIAGLLAGMAIWAYTLVLPLLQITVQIPHVPHDLGLEWLYTTTKLDKWQFAAFWSLTMNTLLFIAVSLLSRQRPVEREAALACRREVLQHAPTTMVNVHSLQQFRHRLSQVVGFEVAQKEVSQALRDLNLQEDEIHTADLNRLRMRLERNLSGLIGPGLANMIINERLELEPVTRTAIADAMQHIEARLQDSSSHLRGLTGELEILHRYYRQLLLELPVGVCALSHDREIIVWNGVMQRISGINANEVTGKLVGVLDSPWSHLIRDFIDDENQSGGRVEIQLHGKTRIFNRQKQSVPDISVTKYSKVSGRPGTVVIIEDLTELENLEAELAHSERLASIGRLAAGVAHEIGNPVTGIACLAQNLRDEQEPEEVNNAMKLILEQTQRINRIVQSLMTFSHSGTEGNTLSCFSPEELFDDALQLMRLTERGRTVTFRKRCEPGLSINSDRARLTQVLVNLLNNACDASPENAVIEVVSQRAANESSVEIEIHDEGAGIPEQYRERIFEPFFTTKAPGRGTGLGLALVYKIVMDLGGRVELESEWQRGVCARICLPVEVINKTVTLT